MQLDTDALVGGVAVVGGAGADFAGEEGVADDVHPPVGPGDVLLELGRAPTEVVEAVLVIWAELADETSNAADGLVDDSARPGPPPSPHPHGHWTK